MSTLKGCDNCGAHNDTPRYGEKSAGNRLNLMVIRHNRLMVFCDKECMNAALERMG